jgi:PAS domain S-box-containing protein
VPRFGIACPAPAVFISPTLPSPLRSRIRRHRLPLLAGLIILAGLLAGRWGYVSTRNELLHVLISDAKRAAAAFDKNEIAQLTGTAEDEKSPAYTVVKDRLMRYRAADTDVHFVYLFRVQPESPHVIFLADSEPAGSPDISLPGEAYPEAVNSPGLQSILQHGEPATEGPIKDAFGTWVTGYALVSRDADGNVKEVLGVDMAAANWWWQIWFASAKAAFYVWVLFGFALVGYTVLRRQQEQNEVIRNLSEAIEQSHTAVMIIDLQGRIEYANQGFCAQVGHSRRDLIGKPWREFIRETIPAETATDIAAIFYARRNWSGEWMNNRPDGTSYPLRGIITAVRDRQDHVTCFVAIYEDLSEVRRNETILREAKEQAEAGDRAKSHFLATMSHEVRTPLNGIVGFTNLLLETPLNAEQEEYMRTIRSSGEALIQLTNDILDSARIETGKLKLDLQPTDPRECV